MSPEEKTHKRIADLERSAHQSHDDPALVQLVRAYLDGGRVPAAVSKLDARLAEGAGTLALLELVAEAHTKSGDLDRAIDWFERHEKPLREEAQYWTLRGRLLEATEDWDGALAAHDKSLELDPDHPEAFFRIGVTLMRMGRERDAIQAFEQCLKSDPEMTKAHINLGILFDELGQPERAIDCFQRALQLDPRSVESRLNLGAAYGDLGRQREALSEFQAAMDLDPSNVLAQFNIGVALMDDSPDDAQAALRRVLALEPGHWEANYHLGLLSFKRGQYEVGMRHFQQCLETRPDSVRALYHLGLTYNKKDQPGRAVECLTRVCELDPRNSQAHFYLGVAYDKRGQYDKARLCYQAAERLKRK